MLKTLCKKLTEEDKENRKEDRLLFDIVAGTSIGGINGTIVVSQFLERKEQLEKEGKKIGLGQCWDEDNEKLLEFWTKQISLSPDISKLQTPWIDEWKKENPTAAF